jgi:hypothetical protein
MNATHPLAVVRLRLSCADVLEYDATRAAELELNGVFIPSSHARAMGQRVRLDLELLDGSRAYSGPAVVVSQVSEGPRAGYRLALEAPAGGGIPTPVPAPARPPPLRGAPRASAPPIAPRPAPRSAILGRLPRPAPVRREEEEPEQVRLPPPEPEEGW